MMLFKRLEALDATATSGEGYITAEYVRLHAEMLALYFRNNPDRWEEAKRQWGAQPTPPLVQSGLLT